MYTIAVDAMGGDFAPLETVKGAVKAAQDKIAKIILVGDEAKINEVIKKERLAKDLCEIVHTEEYVTMEENPTSALKSKKKASIVLAAGMVKDKKADAFVSAGNTGALMETALFVLGRIKGIRRPAIVTFWPNINNLSMMLDSGANAECKPEYLLQFAQMGSIYSEKVLGIKNPRVGLLNIGSEPIKGNDLVKEAYKLIESSSLNFAGNVEMRDFFFGCVEVGVCDGFTGNMILKTIEGMAKYLETQLKSEVKKNIFYIIGALLLKPAIKKMGKHLDHAEIGAAPLLGVQGLALKSHGRAKERAIYNAVKSAVKAVDNKVMEHMESLSDQYQKV
ncbi:MAG: phosphate acyltransferase PlsX [Armatimonadota bacterium]